MKFKTYSSLIWIIAKSTRWHGSVEHEHSHEKFFVRRRNEIIQDFDNDENVRLEVEDNCEENFEDKWPMGDQLVIGPLISQCT